MKQGDVIFIEQLSVVEAEDSGRKKSKIGKGITKSVVPANANEAQDVQVFLWTCLNISELCIPRSFFIFL